MQTKNLTPYETQRIPTRSQHKDFTDIYFFFSC